MIGILRGWWPIREESANVDQTTELSGADGPDFTSEAARKYHENNAHGR